MNFNKSEYINQLNNKQTYQQAVDSLELAIKRADIKDVIQLKKLRTPPEIIKLELDRLVDAGFNPNQLTPQGEPELLVRAWKAGYEHAKKHWGDRWVTHYDMSAYTITEDVL